MDFYFTKEFFFLGGIVVTVNEAIKYILSFMHAQDMNIHMIRTIIFIPPSFSGLMNVIFNRASN